MPDALCLLRGGGDLATGVAWRLTRAGYPVVVAELAQPLTVRRTVALSSAVTERRVSIEGMEARLAADADEAVRLAYAGPVGVVVSPELPAIGADVVVDARLAKRNLDTTIGDGRLVVALGPGFTAGVDCHAVVETKRGHRLGRCLWQGAAAPDTGTPGTIGGRGPERVVRAPRSGPVDWSIDIGDQVTAGQRLGAVVDAPLAAPFDGVIRGLIRPGTVVTDGLKIADVDPRSDTPVDEISDKALAVGGGVVEAVLTWERRGS
ncbi:MAG: selenium-dependent molybdenum cofactor biosynthesis protein YqeB [Actinomycetota bacterium]